jgi:hypothetical protein
MNGFDGKHEQGGRVDVYEPGANVWSSHEFVHITQHLTRALMSQGTRIPLTEHGNQMNPTRNNDRTKVEAQGDESPAPRGWFDADVLDAGSVVVHGGHPRLDVPGN